MDRAKVIDRIQKLLALATSSNEAEAASAAAAAQRLLHQYQLSRSDLTPTQDYVSVPLVIPPWWATIRAQAIAEQLAVVIINDAGGVALQQLDGRYLIVGDDTVVTGARLLITYLFEVIERLALLTYQSREQELTDPILGRHPVLDEPGERRRWLCGYVYGVEGRIILRLAEARKATTAEVADGSRTALMVVESALLRQRNAVVSFLTAKGAKALPVNVNAGRVPTAAVEAGHRAGDQLPLRPPKGSLT